MVVARDVKLGPNPRSLVGHLRSMQEDGITGLYCGGYGYATFHFARAFKELGWDPPRVMGTAFMFYTSRNVVLALACDPARAGIHGIGNAAMATPEEVKDGLERIRWLPATAIADSPSGG
jgi:branched-chain amino acid transport system substrate-binding protein